MESKCSSDIKNRIAPRKRVSTPTSSQDVSDFDESSSMSVQEKLETIHLECKKRRKKGNNFDGESALIEMKQLELEYCMEQDTMNSTINKANAALANANADKDKAEKEKNCS